MKGFALFFQGVESDDDDSVNSAFTLISAIFLEAILTGAGSETKRLSDSDGRESGSLVTCFRFLKDTKNMAIQVNEPSLFTL